VKHVAPHRWADLAAGRIGEAEANRIRAHVAECSRCARARDRVTGAYTALPDIARAPAPELGWDHIGARVYWAVSSERRSIERTSRQRAVRRRRLWVAVPMLGAVASAAAIAALVMSRPAPPAPPVATAPAPAIASPAPTPVELVPAALTGVVTLVTGEVDLDGATTAGAILDHAVAAGSIVRTGAGRAGVQFGAGSAFTVGAGSTVSVRRFDAAAIELAVDGDISVEVSARAPGQRFAVVAGDRTVEVRGTAFRVVHREGALRVSCSHGRVAVYDSAAAARGEVYVGAGHELAVGDGEPLLDRNVRPMTGAALAALAAAEAPRLPTWTDAASLYRTSGALVVAAGHGSAVRVDGVAMGQGSMTLRVMSGRHLIEAERAPGRWSQGDWIEVGGSGPEARVDIEDIEEVVVEAPSPVAARTARTHQLDASLDHGRVATCLRAVSKQGITDTYVELEVGVDADGALSFLNITSTDLPRSTAACVRDAVAAVKFPAGPAATWHHRLTF